MQPGGEEGGGRPQGGPGGFGGPGVAAGGGRWPDRGGRGGGIAATEAVATGRSAGPRSEVFFDPAQSAAELVDELAQRQARGIRRIAAAGAGEVLHARSRSCSGCCSTAAARRWKQVEPRLRLLRSKAYYANRRIGQGHGVPREFRDFVDRSVQSVRNEEDFMKFAQHFEAVVGFLYGMGSVQS